MAGTSILKVIQDPARLATLEASALLDSPPEEAFDRFTKLAGKILNCPVCLVSLVDKDRQFFKSSIGLSDVWACKRETPLSHSFCQHVVSNSERLIVEDARQHPLVTNNLAIEEMGFVAYLGIPLTSHGQALGSMCAIDTKPREWSAESIEILEGMAAAVMTEIELRTVAKQLQTNCLQLRSLQLQRDELVHMLVHDLRNPLLSLLGGMSSLERVSGQDEKQKKCVSIARRGGNALLSMINDILDVSKSEAGRLELEIVELEPSHVVEAACAAIIELGTMADVTLTASLDPKLPVILADEEKLRRTLVNLLANGIQHSFKGGQVNITAQTSDSEDAVVFVIADHGCGIPREAFGKIFNKYGDVKTASARRTSTGLGLPFCKMVVEAHGGAIGVESELGQGNYFPADDSMHSKKLQADKVWNLIRNRPGCPKGTRSSGSRVFERFVFQSTHGGKCSERRIPWNSGAALR